MANIENINREGSYPKGRVVTSEMMQEGIVPDIVMAGACATVTEKGVVPSTGRDTISKNLVQKGYTYFEVQKLKYDYVVDGPAEKKAREEALVRLYELRNDVISGVTHEEILNDDKMGRRSIVWIHSEGFAPIGLGDRKTLEANEELRQKVGDLVFNHLLAYVNCGRQMRSELIGFLAGSSCITFVYGDETVVEAEIEKAVAEVKLKKLI